MAQEYKAFDIKHKNNRGKTFENICKSHGRPADEDWVNIKSFEDAHPGYYLIVHSRESIRAAVYRAPGADEWQFFRVGLHDIDTKQKLYCLAWYYSQDTKDYLRRVRIDNYLGALIRGGILDNNLRILR